MRLRQPNMPMSHNPSATLLSRHAGPRYSCTSLTNIARGHYGVRPLARHPRHHGFPAACGGHAMIAACRTCVALLAATMLSGGADAAEFYQGKQITIVVGFT